jgi:DNA-binding GntR family transcriptional regulator
MKKTVVRVSSLTEQVYMLIVNKIQNNELRHGDRLNIEELAREFNASRTPVREAINRLIQEGLVEQVHNAGPRIVTLSKRQIMDLIFTNATLFTGVSESLASIAEKDRIEKDRIIGELADNIEMQKKYLEKSNSDKFFIYASEFHKVLINHCENQKLKQLTMLTQIQIEMCVLYYLKDDFNRKKSLEDHERLLRFFEAGDTENLISGMKAHNLSALEYFEKMDWTGDEAES